MGKVYEEITSELKEWIEKQQLFFVATSPLAAEGLVNCSPKGLDTFRILGSREVTYLDLTGSGVETVAHLRENGRIVMLFCAFDGGPKLVRLHGKGSVLFPGDEGWEERRSAFTDHPGVRSIVRVQVTRVSTSCGFTVPRYDYVEQRDQLAKWAEAKGPEALDDYQQAKNLKSHDGLSGVPKREGPA